MIVAGLDLSLTSTGIAILRDGRPIMLRSIGTDGGIKDDDHRIDRITQQTWNVVRTIKDKAMPDLVLVEKPLTFGTNGTADSYDRYSLYVEVCRQFKAWKVPIVYVNNRTRASWATGKGYSSKELTAKQKKQLVLNAVRATWEPWAGHITNDDIGDALCLAEIGARYLGEPLHFPVRRRHVEAMANSITWPSGLVRGHLESV